MAQLHLLLCSPSPPPLSFSQTPPPPLLPIHSSTLPSRTPSLSLSSFHRPLSSASASAVSVYGEHTSSVESESEDLSRTRLVAQNVPWTSTADDIRSLFQNHGTVVDVQLSMHNKMRNRGLAFVEMGSPEEAIEALTKLEAHEFEGRTLKLNYAIPITKKPSPIQPKKPLSFNLIVANLAYAVTSEDLKEFFSSAGYRVVSAGVVLEGNPRRSAGYGFVSFPTKREAVAALSYFQGKELLDRPVQLDRCKKFVKVIREVKPESEDAASSSELIFDQVEESNGS